eukprot:m.58563 g.58563  ORF g.58563 m.58563 type:complete len:102 (-) comp12880_c0_seq2:1117-1422(-)
MHTESSHKHSTVCTYIVRPPPSLMALLLVLAEQACARVGNNKCPLQLLSLPQPVYVHEQQLRCVYICAEGNASSGDPRPLLRCKQTTHHGRGKCTHLITHR